MNNSAIHLSTTTVRYARYARYTNIQSHTSRLPTPTLEHYMFSDPARQHLIDTLVRMHLVINPVLGE